ncbi:uncharacterized protein LOC130710765 [Lotus japonicus]|uniref:uncharacterized protein LOC130710765 n=1 Tax=Lotus japonicus TaxID=34305 RepID=UPI00258CEFA1|nr:uncharacterized protein LOC130710765 [Lotus japonicus]
MVIIHVIFIVAQIERCLLKTSSGGHELESASRVVCLDGIDPNPERDKGSNRWRKLEIPIFGGDDAYGWTHKLERYFALRGVSEEDRMQATLLALEGKALSWFQWWERCNPNPTWEGFKLAVIRRFQSAMVHNPFELLLSLKQTGTVEAFVEEFEKYVGALKEIDQDFAKGIFLNGLKEEVKMEVKLYELPTLTAVIQKSLMIEQKNLVLNKSSYPSYTRPNSYSRSNSYNKVVTIDAKGNGDKKTEPTVGSSVSGGVGATTTFRSGDYKHLTSDEMREKRDTRLCFRLDEPYSMEHRCKNKQMKMIILGEEEVDEGDDKEEEVEHFNSLQLSLYFMAGLTTAKSWKIAGQMKGKPVVVMIDCGASHNFIAEELIPKLALTVTNTSRYTVEVGDGYKNFYLFNLQGVDIVLGLDWLASLGEVKADFGKLVLSIKQGDEWITISGDPSLTKTQLSLAAFMQVRKAEKEGLLLHCTDAGEDIRPEITVPGELLGVLQQFDEVFQDPKGLPPSRSHDHAIHLKEGAEIPNLRPYKCPHFQKSEVEKLVGDMLQAGVIRPSISPYSSPIILVKKKDGGWRFCVDYRALNKITIPNKFPIPIIEELLDEIGEAKIFSKLDLKSGYHQIRMRTEDVEKTAFRTHEGHYEFLVMPFGLTNAPSTFQALMNTVLKPFLRRFALVFFDDILVYSQDIHDHVAHLNQVLTVLEENSLKANKKKCCFGQQSLEYLGHIISGQGVAADQKKVAAMQQWPIPKDIKGLRGFLGLTGYYRKFVRDYGKLAKPLTDLTKKDSFQWSEAATTSFNALKTAMVDLPLLAVLDFSKQFVVETDASSKGLGAVLMQEGKPLAFWSKGLSLRAQQKSVYERELMALVQAVQRWKHYLMGMHFVIKTDQRSLKFLTDQRLFTDDQFKWAVKLIGLDFEIQYKPGHENKVADALSRRDMYSALSLINSEEAEE